MNNKLFRYLFDQSNYIDNTKLKNVYNLRYCPPIYLKMKLLENRWRLSLRLLNTFKLDWKCKVDIEKEKR